MFKNALVATVSTTLLLVILTACAEDEQGDTSATATKTETKKTETKKIAPAKQSPATRRPADYNARRPTQSEMKAPKAQPLEAFQSEAIMGQPVDFSSPENITSSIAAIQKEAGDEAANRVETAINYLLVYDLSVGRNKQKLYAKLNGKTPNQILAMTHR